MVKIMEVSAYFKLLKSLFFFLCSIYSTVLQLNLDTKCAFVMSFRLSRKGDVFKSGLFQYPTVFDVVDIPYPTLLLQLFDNFEQYLKTRKQLRK